MHMALESQSIGVLTLACPDKRFPSVARVHPPALRLERTIHDLYGLVPEGCPDQRGWLDHGRWGVRHPLGERAVAPGTGDTYAFHAAEGPPLHQIPVGPVHAGIIEPGHFRFNANGETVVRLEQRLGYVHKGIDGLMVGAPLERAAKLAARVSGDSTVAYSIAFARAVEAALGIEAPGRALWLAALMAELERLANHLGDIGAICNDASFSLLHAHCGILREHVLRACNACFGHRLMMDRVVPGGVTADLDKNGIVAIRTLLDTINRHFPELIELYDNTTSLQDRTVSTGILSSALVTQYGAGGFVGRASGGTRDMRKMPGYAPYNGLSFEVPTRREGDVDARVWVRIDEVKQSLRLIEQFSIACLTAHSGQSASILVCASRRWKGWRWRRVSVVTCSPGCASAAMEKSRAVICAIRPGFNGHCWKPPSKATSLPIFRSAINPSTARIPVTICETSCANCYSRACCSHP